VAEWAPGVLELRLAAWTVEDRQKLRNGLTALALATEKQARINASSGSHKRGTRTPASPGSGPARITGTLVRDITHSAPEWSGLDLFMKVGMGAGIVGPGSRTPTSKVGLYLETGLRNGAVYPFLGPAVQFARSILVPTIAASFRL